MGSPPSPSASANLWQARPNPFCCFFVTWYRERTETTPRSPGSGPVASLFRDLTPPPSPRALLILCSNPPPRCPPIARSLSRVVRRCGGPPPMTARRRRRNPKDPPVRPAPARRPPPSGGRWRRRCMPLWRPPSPRSPGRSCGRASSCWPPPRTTPTPSGTPYGSGTPSICTGLPLPRGCALEGTRPQRRPQRRLGRRLEEVAEAVGGGYCRLQVPLWLALGVRETVAGHRLGALEGEGVSLPLPIHPCTHCYVCAHWFWRRVPGHAPTPPSPPPWPRAPLLTVSCGPVGPPCAVPWALPQRSVPRALPPPAPQGTPVGRVLRRALPREAEPPPVPPEGHGGGHGGRAAGRLPRGWRVRRGRGDEVCPWGPRVAEGRAWWRRCVRRGVRGAATPTRKSGPATAPRPLL